MYYIFCEKDLNEMRKQHSKKYKDPVLVEWAKTFRRETTAKTYLNAIIRYCVHYRITPEQLTEFSLETIEKQTEKYIFENKGKISPSFLNITYSAIKKFCLWQNKIKSFAQFKQIDFDKSSRTTKERAFLTPQQFRDLFDHADIREKCVLGLYGIHGLRPALIPQLKIEDIHGGWQSYVNNNQIELEEYCWLMVKPNYAGNKARIHFPIILTNETANWISQHLSSRARNGEKLTGKTQLVEIPTRHAVGDLVRKIYQKIGFNGRPYLLRHYANKLMKKAYDDAELKEWCMSHKGTISAIYDHEHYLTDEEITDYNKTIHMDKMYVYQSGNTRIPKLQEAVTQQEKEIATLKTRLEAAQPILLDQENTIRELKKRLIELKQKTSYFTTLTQELEKKLRRYPPQEEMEEMYSNMLSIKEELELKKKAELVGYVASRAPTDRELKEFMKLRRMSEDILKDDDMQCIQKFDGRWIYDHEGDYLKHGYLSVKNAQSKKSN